MLLCTPRDRLSPLVFPFHDAQISPYESMRAAPARTVNNRELMV